MSFFVGLPVNCNAVVQEGIDRLFERLEWARVSKVILNAHCPGGAY